mmetsp:Transcript_37114/g.97740  ORF Transcript_37114/g.97740 Transcript_37114/m.97740 type:complete len:215 (-) Transcript_37114:589-1233(-)
MLGIWLCSRGRWTFDRLLCTVLLVHLWRSVLRVKGCRGERGAHLYSQTHSISSSRGGGRSSSSCSSSRPIFRWALRVSRWSGWRPCRCRMSCRGPRPCRCRPTAALPPPAPPALPCLSSLPRQPCPWQRRRQLPTATVYRTGMPLPTAARPLRPTDAPLRPRRLPRPPSPRRRGPLPLPRMTTRYRRPASSCFPRRLTVRTWTGSLPRQTSRMQ